MKLGALPTEIGRAPCVLRTNSATSTQRGSTSECSGAWMKYRMGELTAAEARDILPTRPVVLLPMGSHEDQGPHAPMGDYFGQPNSPKDRDAIDIGDSYRFAITNLNRRSRVSGKRSTANAYYLCDDHSRRSRHNHSTGHLRGLAWLPSQFLHGAN